MTERGKTRSEGRGKLKSSERDGRGQTSDGRRVSKPCVENCALTDPVNKLTRPRDSRRRLDTNYNTGTEQIGTRRRAYTTAVHDATDGVHRTRGVHPHSGVIQMMSHARPAAGCWRGRPVALRRCLEWYKGAFRLYYSTACSSAGAGADPARSASRRIRCQPHHWQ